MLNPTRLQIELSAALVAGAAIALAFLFVRVRKQHATILPDGRPAGKIHHLTSTHPIFGDVRERLENLDRQYDWMVDQSLWFNGEPWAVVIPGLPRLVFLTLPEAVEEVSIKQFDNFIKGPYITECLLDMFGTGLVTSDGARWHQRKIGAKFFSPNVLRTIMTETMQANVREIWRVIDTKMAAPEHRVDLKQLFLEFTLETFAQVGFGVPLNCIGAAKPHLFQHALDVIGPITTRRFAVPGFVWKTERWLGRGLEGKMTEQKAILRAWLDDTIQQSLEHFGAKKAGDENQNSVKSVVELFFQYGGEDVEGVGPSDLADFLLAFVVAARDTTADTLCWLVFALSKHAHVLDKIRAELKAHVGDHGVISYLTTEHTKKLTYLEATLNETLRLYPAAPSTVRQVARDTVICGDILLKKHDMIAISPYAIARHPRVWGPDAAEFKPERTGPRTCIGMNLAMLELRILAANFFYRYDIEVDPSNDGSYEVGPTLTMKRPLWVKATRRVWP